MYIGISTNEGKKVHDEDALAYAMESVFSSYYDFVEFMAQFKDDINNCSISDWNELKKDIVEWFYSGAWTHVEDADKEIEEWLN